MKAKKRDRDLLFETSRPDITNRLRDLVKIPHVVRDDIRNGPRNPSLSLARRVADNVLSFQLHYGSQGRMGQAEAATNELARNLNEI
jgi:hypothetical protein